MSGPRKLRRESIETVALAPWKAGQPKPEDVISGPVEMENGVLWRSRDGRSANGLFTAQPSRLRVVHPLDQSLVVLAGVVSYAEEGEEPLLLEAGDALVITAGARYEVEVLEPAELFWTMTSQDGPITFLDDEEPAAAR